MFRDCGEEALYLSPYHVVLLVTNANKSNLVGMRVGNESDTVEVKEVRHALSEPIDIDVLICTNYSRGEPYPFVPLLVS